MLADLENAGISSISDGASGTARHVVRLRELAISAMVEATAQSRMRMAENSKTRMSGELLGLEPEDQVDLYRKPARKDLSGWRGPAEIVSVNDIPRGMISLKWGGKVINARVQDARKHFMIFLVGRK
jgi:hypothetical protein